MRVGLTKLFRFEAAHRLPNYLGKCAHPHGHSYRLEVTVSAEAGAEDASGVLVDFDTIKLCVNDVVVSRYDHKDLNAFFARPTAEIMVQKMYHDLVARFSVVQPPVQVEQLRLWETETCSATYPYLPRAIMGTDTKPTAEIAALVAADNDIPF